MGWFERISGCKDMFLYGGCDWAFFNNHVPCGDCQANGVDIENSRSTYIFGTNVRAIRTMFRSDGQAIAERADNGGGFQGNDIGGVVAAYLFNSD
jgi:glucan 1,3-beta-glucosidase